MMRAKKGFTLVEIMVVLIVMAILAVIVVPRFLPQTERSAVAEAVSILGAIRQGQKAFFAETGTYRNLTAGSTDDDWGRLGIDNPNSGADWTFVSNASGTSTATRSSGSEQNATIILDINGGWSGTHTYRPT